MGEFLREALDRAAKARCDGLARQWILLVADDDGVQLGVPFPSLPWLTAWYIIAPQGQLQRAWLHLGGLLTPRAVYRLAVCQVANKCAPAVNLVRTQLEAAGGACSHCFIMQEQ